MTSKEARRASLLRQEADELEAKADRLRDEAAAIEEELCSTYCGVCLELIDDDDLAYCSDEGECLHCHAVLDCIDGNRVSERRAALAREWDVAKRDGLIR